MGPLMRSQSGVQRGIVPGRPRKSETHNHCPLLSHLLMVADCSYSVFHCCDKTHETNSSRKGVYYIHSSGDSQSKMGSTDLASGQGLPHSLRVAQGIGWQGPHSAHVCLKALRKSPVLSPRTPRQQPDPSNLSQLPPKGFASKHHHWIKFLLSVLFP